MVTGPLPAFLATSVGLLGGTTPARLSSPGQPLPGTVVTTPRPVTKINTRVRPRCGFPLSAPGGGTEPRLPPGSWSQCSGHPLPCEAVGLCGALPGVAGPRGGGGLCWPLGRELLGCRPLGSISKKGWEHSHVGGVPHEQHQAWGPAPQAQKGCLRPKSGRASSE